MACLQNKINLENEFTSFIFEVDQPKISIIWNLENLKILESILSRNWGYHYQNEGTRKDSSPRFTGSKWIWPEVVSIWICDWINQAILWTIMHAFQSYRQNSIFRTSAITLECMHICSSSRDIDLSDLATLNQPTNLRKFLSLYTIKQL